MMSGSAGELRGRVEQARNGHQAAKDQLSKAKTYITYTLRDGNGAVRYVGRASGIGTPEQVMRQRISKGHKIVKANPNLTPKIEALQGNSAANRGAEDVLYEYHKREGADLLNDPKSPPLSNLRQKIERSKEIITVFHDDRKPDMKYLTSQSSRSTSQLLPKLPTTRAANIVENTPVRGGGLRGASRILGPIGAAMDAYSLKEAYDADGGRVGENFKETAGGVVGGMVGGAAMGAAVGSVVPIVGTVVGGIVGGIIGSMVGEEIGEKL